MRETLLKRLDSAFPPIRHRQFLIYLMGPYKSHITENEEMFSRLEALRDKLRSEGYNAFLATDPDIPLEELDAGTQSLKFARASNVVLFVVPDDGKNLGVGIEVGAVLEDMSTRQRQRILFLHEDGMRSAMIGAIGDRWNVFRRTFEDDDDLWHEALLFVRDVMRKEVYGDLSRIFEEDSS
ncbi:DUF7509 family protein [Halorussus ruber]|uniref:DUF7509 family protein n=1 Tax=Halorussus ruber TaxID=1126238 RepID=UPI0010922495|nr:hypothetical protein [Halorussus ruber]